MSSFWGLTEDEQRELLGTDIGHADPLIIVELDEQSLRRFYHRRFALLEIRQGVDAIYGEMFRVIVHSCDDATLNMVWDVTDMDLLPHEARELISTWLTRTNYFLNLKGFESFCSIFGKRNIDYS